MVSWVVNVLLWVAPVFEVWKGGGMMEWSLAQDKTDVVGRSAELACLSC